MKWIKIELCPNKCSNNGICQDDGCECKPGWGGEDCSRAKIFCPVFNCSNHGECVFLVDKTKPEGAIAVCQCQQGYEGPGCDMPICPNGCNEEQEQGRCIAPGKCQCSPKFFGSTCDKPFCPNDCSGHGTCDKGVCRCLDRWGGESCEIGNFFLFNWISLLKSFKLNSFIYCNCILALGCNSICELHGVCQGNKCICDDGFYGENCESMYCPGNCTGHGRCDNGKCICEPGFTGTNCGALVDQVIFNNIIITKLN